MINVKKCLEEIEEIASNTPEHKSKDVLNDAIDAMEAEALTALLPIQSGEVVVADGGRYIADREAAELVYNYGTIIACILRGGGDERLAIMLEEAIQIDRFLRGDDESRQNGAINGVIEEE